MPMPVRLLKLIPSRVTGVPALPKAGKKFVITGALVTKKLFELVVVPPEAVVTEILPVVAVAGTCALIWVGAVTAAVESPIPLNFTIAPLLKLAPLMRTLTPGAPTAGEKSSMIGAGPVTTKLFVVVAPPAGVRSEERRVGKECRSR